MTDLRTSIRNHTRGVAFALAAASALAVSATPSTAAEFTKDQCTTILGVSLGTVERLGPSTLSPQFKGSLKAFLIPDGKKVSCQGTKDILTPTVNDVAAFNTIRTFLLAGSNPISLEKAGLRSVDPATLASNPNLPGPSKRSELGGPAVN